jgi:multiple sugar transport system substrate-binding protein
MRRTGAAAAALLAITLTGCAAGPEPSDDGPIDLEFVTWQMQEAGIKDWWAAVIDKFEEEHPGVTVTPRYVESTDMAEFVTNRFASDSPPQIIHLPTEVFPAFADEGWLEPLDDRLAGTDILDNWPAAQSLMKWDGSVQGLMIFGYPVQLYYNEALLDAAGQEVPTTPEELVEVATALTQGEVYGFGTVTIQHRDLFRQASSHVVGFGGDWAADGKFDITSPDTLAGLENFRDVAAFSPQGIDSAQKRELFLQGKIAMMLDGPFIIPTLADAAPDVAGHVKVARSPFEEVSYYPANGLHIPADISDREKDLAWDFLELSASPEMQDLFVELYQSPAARAGAGANVELSPLLEEFIAGSAESKAIIPDSTGVQQEFGTFDRLVQDGIMEMLTSDRSVKDIFTDVQAKVESAGIKP